MNRRTERIGKLLQHKIGEILLRELSDPRIDYARTSITRVTVHEDLLEATVYVSVMGPETQGRLTLEALNHAAGRIRLLLRDSIDLRTMPALVFVTDENFKKALKTWEILREVSKEIRAKDEKLQARESPEDAPAAPAGEADQGGSEGQDKE